MMKLDRSRLKTPAHDGEVLVEPKPQADHWRKAVEEWNRRHGSHPLARPIAGCQTLGELRQAVRSELAEAGAELAGDSGLLIVTGHQVGFYHAGVWAKNVAAGVLARHWQGGCLNLVVDHDSPTAMTVSLPGLIEGKPGLHKVELPGLKLRQALEFAPPMPHATWRVLDETYAAYQCYARLAPDAGHPWSVFREEAEHPNHPDFVNQVMAGRQALERSLGVHLPDVRTSVLSRTAGFLGWLADAIAHAEELHSAYNQALADYRGRHGFHGTQRPVPNLGRTERRLELPFWAYGPGTPRHRLWGEPGKTSAMLYADEIFLGEWGYGESLSEWMRTRADLRSAAKQTNQADESEHNTRNAETYPLCLRPRALTLTLFVRLFLADLFIHGIGGVKYDEITDQIMLNYYGIEPPPMACVSATVLLPPIHGTKARGEEKEGAAAEAAPKSTGLTLGRSWPTVLRRSFWNPQELVTANDPDDFRELAGERQKLGQESLRLRGEEPGNAIRRRAVYQEIHRLNERLRELGAERITRLEQEAEAARETARQAGLAHNREYFFGFLPAEKLHRLKNKLAGLW